MSARVGGEVCVHAQACRGVEGHLGSVFVQKGLSLHMLFQLPHPLEPDGLFLGQTQTYTPLAIAQTMRLAKPPFNSPFSLK